jgi:hypothetical protein
VGNLRAQLDLQEERLEQNSHSLHRSDEQLREERELRRQERARRDSLKARLRVQKDEAAALRRELGAAAEQLKSAKISAAVAAVQQRHPVPVALLPRPLQLAAPAAAAAAQPDGSATAACHEWTRTGTCSMGALCPYSRTHTLAIQMWAHQQMATASSSAADPPAPGTSI